MKFLFFTDLHLTGRNPPSRKDKFFQTLLAKLREITSLASSNGVDFIVFGGDLFDAHRCYSYDILADAINIFRSAPCQIYMLVGQHDLLGYNSTSFSYSSANFVAELSGGKLKVLREPLNLGELSIFPCHVYDTIQDVMVQAGASGSPCPIVVAHALVTEKAAIYETTLTSSLPDTETRLVLCGDYHNGFPPHQYGSTLYYSPGAIARLKASSGDMGRTVKCAIVEVKEGTIQLDEIPLVSALPAESVFTEREEEDTVLASTGVNIDPFLERLEQVACEATDIFQLLAMMAGPDVDPKVMGYIDGFKKVEK